MMSCGPDGDGRWADFHLHSSRSDGSDSPAQVACRAAGAGMAALALTDHDTVLGVEEARAGAEAAGIAFLTGVEISASLDRREVHVVGLGIDCRSEPLLGLLSGLRAGRRERSGRMLRLLANAGISLELPETPDEGPGSFTGRMHIAAALHARGVTRSVQDGFDRFLKPGRPAWVPKTLVPVEEAVNAIHGASGLAFLAHPGLGSGFGRMLPLLLSLPFDGIEAFHVSHTPRQTGEFLAVARERGLLVSGGSDCHGTIKGRAPEMGRVKVPWEWAAPLVERLAMG